MLFVRQIFFFLRKIFLFLKKIFFKIFIFISVKIGFARKEKSIDIENGFLHRNYRRHHELVKMIEDKVKNKNVAVLDIGCGGGNLIKLLKAKKYLDLYGCDWIEKTSPDYKYLKVDLNEEGLSVYADSTFDLVIASDVLEHMENPARILREIHRITKPTGHIFITIPNCWNIYERYYFLLTGNSSRYQSERRSSPNGHISFFTRNIMESLADRASLKLIELNGSYCFFWGHFWNDFKHPLLSYNLIYYYVPII